ncbi:hypothetical protein L9F63_000037, partial [Diploptera punctata]
RYIDLLRLWMICELMPCHPALHSLHVSLWRRGDYSYYLNNNAAMTGDKISDVSLCDF